MLLLLVHEHLKAVDGEPTAAASPAGPTNLARSVDRRAGLRDSVNRTGPASLDAVGDGVVHDPPNMMKMVPATPMVPACRKTGQAVVAHTLTRSCSISLCPAVIGQRAECSVSSLVRTMLMS